MLNGLLRKTAASVLAVSMFGMAAAPAGAATVEQLLAQLAMLQAQLAALQAVAPAPAPAPAVTFERNLRLGLRGDDVRALQEYLRGTGHFPAGQAATGFFGPLTRRAVAEWQAANNLPSTGFFGPLSRARHAALTAPVPVIVAPPVAPVPIPPDPAVPAIPAGLNVGLAADTPAAGTVIERQAIAELARFTFTNGDAAEVRVTRVVLTRTGVSADATLGAVYLYDGARRITELAAVSAGRITFTSALGIFSVPAGGSRTISVRSDIAADTAGQTVGVRIASAADIESNATALAGAFPLSGNLMSVARAALATVSVGATGIDSTTVTAGSTDFVVWQSTLTVGARPVELAALQLRQIGGVRADDIRNFRLFVGGVQRATAVLAADNTLTFDMSAAPLRLTPGSARVEVRADIVSGSTRTFSFSLWRASDLDVRDSEFRVNVLATGLFPVSAPTTGTHTVGAGSLTVVRAADSPAGPVVENGTDVPLARYTLTAFGESVRVERLRVNVTGSVFVPADTTLRNGRLLVDGVQVGSTLGLAADGLTYELGGALVVVPGTPRVLEVRADIFDSEGANEIGSGDVIAANLVVLTNNAQALESLSLLSVPGTLTAGLSRSVLAGALVVAGNAAVGNMNVIAGTTNVRIGSFVVQAGAAEAINVSNYRVGVTGTAALANLANLRISESTLVRGMVASTNDYPVTQALAANATRIVDVFVDIGTGVTTGQTIITSLIVTARGAVTGNDVSAPAVTGQTMTVAVGTLAAPVLAADTPVSAIVIGGTTAPVVRYRFAATNEAFTITEARITVPTAAASAVTGVRIGGVTAPLVVDGGIARATFTGDLLVVPKDGNAILNVEAVFNTVSAGAGASGTSVAFTLADYRHRSASGAISGLVVSGLAGNPMTLRRTAPTVTLNPAALSNALGGADHEVLRVDVAANAVEDVDVREIRVTPTITGNALGGVAGVSGSGGIAVFQGGVLRGRVMNLSGTITGLTPAVRASGTGTVTIAAPTATAADLTLNIDGIAIDLTGVTVAMGAAGVADRIRATINPVATRTIDVGGTGATLTYTNRRFGTVGNRTVDMTDGSFRLAANEGVGTVPSIAMTGGAVAPAVAAGTDLTVTAHPFQTGQRVTVAAREGGSAVTGVVTVVGVNTIRIDGAIPATGTATDTDGSSVVASPVGFNTGNTYRVPLTAAVVARGTSSVFSVRAETTGLTTAGNSIQMRILEDTTASTAGNLIWREGTATTDINGNLVRELPITGPALIRP
jgi:peptidoglycan hydrolase-like protein with peptidoglycan-binding domain